MFENKVLRKVFGAKGDQITREWRKLHNAELHALCSSSETIRNFKSIHNYQHEWTYRQMHTEFQWENLWGKDLQQSSFSNLSVTSPTPQLILQAFRRFTYITAHSQTFPLLHLRHSSFPNLSFASPTSQALHLRHLASRPCISPTLITKFSQNIVADTDKSL